MAIDKDILRKSGQKFGKKGGKKTLELHGKEHFRKAALARWGKPKKGDQVKHEPRNRAGGNRRNG